MQVTGSCRDGSCLLLLSVLASVAPPAFRAALMVGSGVYSFCSRRKYLNATSQTCERRVAWPLHVQVDRQATRQPAFEC